MLLSPLLQRGSIVFQSMKGSIFPQLLHNGQSIIIYQMILSKTMLVNSINSFLKYNIKLE